jgi:hypothetical protein
MIPMPRTLLITWFLLCVASLWSAEPANGLLARVGSDTITLAQVDAAIPATAFGPQRTQMRRFRLERLIGIRRQQQYLITNHVTPTDAQVESAWTAQQTGPLPMPCGCHFYTDFADYLTQSLLTRDEARALVWIDCALDTGATRAWDRLHPGDAGRVAVLASEGPALRHSLMHLWQLTFPARSSTPDGPSPRTPLPGGTAWQAARAALERLRQGESMATVAAHADDPGEARRGGDAGLVDSNGPALRHAMGLSTRTPGLPDEPIPGYQSWLVLRWQEPTDQDLYDYLRNRFLASERSRLEDAAQAFSTPLPTPAGKALLASGE